MSTTINRTKSMWFFIAISILLLDQVSKQWIVLSGFHFTRNEGIAFSIPIDGNVALVLSLVITLGLTVWYFSFSSKTLLTDIGFGLIFGGALGNLFDRFFMGSVIDFIRLPFWPSFNLADSAITIGALLLIFHFRKRI